MARRFVTLLITKWPDVNAVLLEWKLAMDRLSNWSWGPGFKVEEGEFGTAVGFVPPGTASSAVSTSAITAAPDADTLGSGTATLRFRRGAVLVDGPEVTVYSNFSVSHASGTRLVVIIDGEAYMLVGADCPP